MDILLDTDACVHLINGSCIHPPELESADVGISSITAYELQVGFEKSLNQKARRETKSFLEAISVFQFDDEAARQSAKVRALLEKVGKGIGPYDTLIAGHCLILNRKLFTGNVREFKRVPKLKLLPLVRS